MQHQLYSLQKVAEIVNGQLVGATTDHNIRDLLIDSRHLMDADQALFFALKSQRNDGHKYIEELYEKVSGLLWCSNAPRLLAPRLRSSWWQTR